MHADYILYVIAVICFVVAGLTAAHPYTSTTSLNMLIVIVLAIIGVIFIGSGYSLRPQTRAVARVEPTIPQTKPAMEERAMPAPATEPSLKPEPTPAAEPMPSPEAIEETKKEEAAPPEAPAKQETKKPTRKRRERKEA
jgi:outer membrane biosynthesis protein TonB